MVYQMPKRTLNGPLKLLSYLLEQNEPVPIMKIHLDTRMPYKTIYTAINVLKELDLLKETIDPGPPMKRLIKLTEKGKQAADHARELLKISGLL